VNDIPKKADASFRHKSLKVFVETKCVLSIYSEGNVCIKTYKPAYERINCPTLFHFRNAQRSLQVLILNSILA